MSDQEQDQVENPAAHKDIQTARNLPDAANAEQSIQGYAAVNGLDEKTEIARRAHELDAPSSRAAGDADGDWFRAEEEIRRVRQDS